jgi:hypothetical protein
LRESHGTKAFSAATHVAASCDCVIDVEAAFDSTAEADSSDEQVGSAGRVDVVAVNDDGVLVLTEVKLYVNPEIRSRAEPAVCAQLVEYYDWARDHADEIRTAYAHVLAYRRALNPYLTFSVLRRQLLQNAWCRFTRSPQIALVNSSRTSRCTRMESGGTYRSGMCLEAGLRRPAPQLQVPLVACPRFEPAASTV